MSITGMKSALRNIDNWVNGAYPIIGLMPVLWLTLIAITAIYVGIQIGHLPTYDERTGPVEILFSNRSPFMFYLMVFCSWGTPYVPVLFLIHYIASKTFTSIPKMTVRRVIYGYMGYAVLWLMWGFNTLCEMWLWYLD